MRRKIAQAVVARERLAIIARAPYPLQKNVPITIAVAVTARLQKP
jgi:hypothetical protein